jgi:hypothetical protein
VVRRLVVAVVAALASAAILITLLAHYVDNVIVNPNSFADHATTVLRTNSVNAVLVTSATDALVPGSSERAVVISTIRGAVREALLSRPVTDEFRSLARGLQAGLVSGSAKQLTLSLPDLGASVAPSIESLSPLLASEVRNIGTVTILDVQIPPRAATIIHDTTRVSDDYSQLLVLSIALIALALVISADRRRTLRGLGLRAVASGLLVAGLYLVGRDAVVNEFSGSDARLAVHAVFTTYLGGLETQGLILAAVGAVAWVAAKLG